MPTNSKSVLALLLALAGCSPGEVVKPITVDVFMCRTGPGCDSSRLETGASEPLQVAVNDVNAAGGINGQELQLWIHDAAPGKALTDALSLKDAGVRVLLSGPSDLTVPLVRNLTVPSKVFVFATETTSPDLETSLAQQAAGYLARTSFSLSGAAMRLARLAHDAGVSRIGVVYSEDSVGPDYSRAFIQAFRDLGGEITGIRPAAHSIPAGEIRSYRSELSQAMAGATLVNGKAAVLAIASPAAFRQMLQDAKEGGLAIQWFGAHTVRARGVLDGLEAQAEGMVGVSPARGNPANYGAYETSFKKSFPSLDPGANWYPHAYDALVVYAFTLARSGGGAPNANKVKSDLRKVANAGIGKKVVGPADLVEALNIILAGGDVDYQGASGAVDFGSQGDVIGRWSLFRVESGKFILDTDPNY